MRRNLTRLTNLAFFPPQLAPRVHTKHRIHMHGIPAWLVQPGKALTGLCLGLAAMTASVTALAQLPSAASHAATNLPAGAGFALSGTTLQGAPFNLASLRGRVVLVYYWATDCPVCLDKMPELRANTQGWRDKPFTVVNVQMDKQPQAAARYWQTVGAALPRSMHTVLWRDEPGYRDSLTQRPQHLPFSVLLDTQGKIVASFDGRIPAQAWDQIAELLP